MFFFLMIRRPPRSTLDRSSAASDVYKRQRQGNATQYLFYQVDHVLTATEKENLKQQGIEILYALHNYIYWVRVSKPLNDDVTRNFFDLSPAYKVATDMTDRSQSGRFRLTIAPGMSCLLYTSPSPRDRTRSRMPSSA